MKRLARIILSICLLIFGLGLPLWTNPANAAPLTRPALTTSSEALNICKNWVALILQLKGNWGSAKTADVQTIQEFKRDARLLGYFCPVKPQGFIVVPLRLELETVKAYSDTGNLDPTLDEGLTDVIKLGMERTLDAIEQKYGPIASVSSANLVGMLEVNYQLAAQQLASNPDDFQSSLSTQQPSANYQGGQVMLTSAWHQDLPYANQTPLMGCSTNNGHAPVGCVATAGAQIMRYWDWPLWGQYGRTFDWPNMADTVTMSSPQAQIDAVAQLSHEVGVSVGMNYGCTGSGANTSDMAGVFSGYGYSNSATVLYRAFYSQIDWFNLMKLQFNINRPVQYRITNGNTGHSIVGDGWQVVHIGGVFTNQYHINYGWGWTGTCSGCNTWYTVDQIFGSNTTGEYIVMNIFPAPSVGATIAGTYGATRMSYFDQDAVGVSATFQNSMYIQFLPGVTATGSGTGSNAIQFQGSSSGNTWLFTRGNPHSGIRIYNGAINLKNGGSIRFPR